MASAGEHFVLYQALRNIVLARHFALGRWHRANLLSLTNHLQSLPAPLQALPEPERQLLRRWNVSEHEHENPLMLTAHLHAFLAVETLLGSPMAEHILGRSLDAVASLVPTSGPTMGYITRWDAAGTDRWHLDAQGRPARCSDFLIDDDGNYLHCVPASDPRHVALRRREALLALRTTRDADRIRDQHGNGVFWGYVDRRRRWEASMDEFSGLFGGWAVADKLVPQLRSRLRPQAIAVAQRLGGNGWTNIRPCGGFAARGGTGTMLAFEHPVDHWVKGLGRPAGAPAAMDFDAVLEAAGYWPVLAGPIAAHRAMAWAGTLVLGPLLLQLGGVAAALGGSILGAGVVIGPSTVGLISALAAHGDCFDLMNDGETQEPIIAALLSALEPAARWRAYLNFVGMSPGSKLIAGNFPPLLALLGVDDANSPVVPSYIDLIRARRAHVAPTEVTPWGLDSALATAVAVALGASDLLPVLVQQLDSRHDALVAAGRDAPIRSIGEGDSSHEAQDVVLALDYLAALALAWFHALRTPGAPAVIAPPSRAAWQALPEPVVPALVMRHLPEVRQAAAGSAPIPVGDWPLFSGGGDQPKQVFRRATLIPPVPPGPAWEYTYIVGRWMRDVPTGLVLQDGHDYQIEATGTVDGLGPAGGDPCDDARWPLHRGLDSGARQGALLVHLGGYVHIGEATARRRFLTWETMPLFLRINRPRADLASNDYFEVSVRIWGPKPATVPPGFIVEFVERELFRTGKRKGQPVRIAAIGGTHGNGERWILSVESAVELILDYGWRFRVRTASGPKLAVVGKRGARRYLRTVGDRSRSNNLRSLPEA